MTRGRLEADPEPLGVIDRGEDRGDLQLAAVARPGVDVAELQRAPVAPGRLLARRANRAQGRGWRPGARAIGGPTSRAA